MLDPSSETGSRDVFWSSKCVEFLDVIMLLSYYIRVFQKLGERATGMAHSRSVVFLSIRRDRGRDSNYDRDEQHRRELEPGGWSFSTATETTRKKSTGCHTRLRE